MARNTVYLGTWSVNNGQLRGEIRGRNFRVLRKRLRVVLNGNLSPRDVGRWTIEILPLGAPIWAEGRI